MKHKLMRYSDIGFRDANEANRQVGKNAHIILVAEKIGQAPFLVDIAEKYKISTIALGGKPSVNNVEYFVDDMKSKKVNLRRKFHVFTLVDFDPHGWIIRNSFLENLNHYGINSIKTTDLVHPDMLSPKEIETSRYRLSQAPGRQWQIVKNWQKQIKGKYKNTRYLVEETKGGHYYCGLESESVSFKRLSQKLAVGILPLIRGK
jgi:5S rRNA maturation endonuclease (ribonuclease M5)